MRGFDSGSFALAVSVITFVFLWVLNDRWEENSKRITRMEGAFKAYCTGAKRLEVCAKLDLPLDLKKFEP